jgi:hypothetical protein
MHRLPLIRFQQFCLAFFLVVAPAVCCGATLRGRVYLDANRNGRLDPGEPGLPGVLVSDGHCVVATDRDGRYQLLWISVPRDHRPSGTFWCWSDGSRAKDFGLVRRPQPNDYCFIQITDTHVGRDELVRAFAQQFYDFPVPVAFVVNTGDLGGDAAAIKQAAHQYDRYLAAIAAFRLPLFNVPGNHDTVALLDKNADKSDPQFGKGRYRQLFGPTYYSWDWGNVHFVALDGTRIPYQEKLGAEQLAWLKTDLAFQSGKKPVILFCHQSAPKLVDARQLADVLRGRNVLGIFCGHLHTTFITRLDNIPVYHTGALCGQWWGGPNIDGTPQGFRIVQIKKGRLKTAYSNREGRRPLYVASPPASTVQRGKIAIEVVVLDFGKKLAPGARYAGQSVPLKLASREELWSTWTGTVDTAKEYDGDRVVHVSAGSGDEPSTCDTRYLVVNGRPEPYQADAPATLKIDTRGTHAAYEVLFDGEPLGTIPATKTPTEATRSFDIPADRLTRMVRVTIRATGSGTRLGPIWLEYKKKKLNDLRYASFERHWISKPASKYVQTEKDLYFCLP